MTTADILAMLQDIQNEIPPQGYEVRLGFEDWFPMFQGSYLQGKDIHSWSGARCIECATKREAVVHCWQHFVAQKQEAQV